MGLTDLPYLSLQLLTIAKFVAYGDHKLEGNPFQWDHVKLNLPGSRHYDAARSWIMKIRFDEELVCEVHVYVGNGRIVFFL